LAPVSAAKITAEKSDNAPSGGQAGDAANKLTGPQRQLQQKLMTEALQKIGDKKELAKKVSRHNPTITAMEIMTRCQFSRYRFQGMNISSPMYYYGEII
jgi:hypothetical protein